MSMMEQRALQRSRRQFVEQCGGGALLLVMHCPAKAQSVVSARVQFKLVKKIDGGTFWAASPDSRRICVGLQRSGGASRALSVIELGSWKAVYSAPLPGEAREFSFFSDSERLYGVAETPRLRESMLIDLRTGGIEKREDEYVRGKTAFVEAIHDRILIGYRGKRLVQVEWPTLREVAGVPLNAAASFLRFSADRKRLIHTVGQSLVCRRAEDFDVLWTRQVDSDIGMMEQGLAGVSISSARYAISGDGSIVALAPRRSGMSGKPERFYLEILNGTDGHPLRRLPENGSDGVALSPDGSLLAIAQMDGVADSYEESPIGRTRIAGGLEPALHIHEVPSGREVTRVVHAMVTRDQRLRGHLDGRRSGFTPDGRYLITSNSYDVKIWHRG
jgi:hypothetical protein